MLPGRFAHVTSTTSHQDRPGWLLPTLSGYRREWLVADVVGGLSAGAVVIPQAMAYATIANLPVQARPGEELARYASLMATGMYAVAYLGVGIGVGAAIEPGR